MQTAIRNEYSEQLGPADGYIRLSPANLPHHYQFQTAVGGDVSPAAVHLTQECVHLSRLLPSGVPVAIDIPTPAFEAVAVRVLPGAEVDTLTVVLELMHADPALSVPLAMAGDFEDLIADWRAWGSVFQLPLVLVEADGQAHVVENRLGSVTLRTSAPRRRSVLAGRRPRFLSRRRPGRVDSEPVFHFGEREISAWD